MTDQADAPSQHHPVDANGVTEAPHVGSIPTFDSAVVEASAHLGVTQMDMLHVA